MKATRDDERTVANRRRFLKTMAAAGGAAAVAGSTTAVFAADRAVEDEPKSKAKQGYSETPHIRDYYAKAGF